MADNKKEKPLTLAEKWKIDSESETPFNIYDKENTDKLDKKGNNKKK